MAKKENSEGGKGTPTPTDREVLKRAGEPVSGETPDAGGLKGNEKIQPVDLSLHGDGVNHWQDEPSSERKKRREGEQKALREDDV